MNRIVQSAPRVEQYYTGRTLIGVSIAAFVLGIGGTVGVAATMLHNGHFAKRDTVTYSTTVSFGGVDIPVRCEGTQVRAGFDNLVRIRSVVAAKGGYVGTGFYTPVRTNNNGELVLEAVRTSGAISTDDAKVVELSGTRDVISLAGKAVQEACQREAPLHIAFSRFI